jgi:hypothetical protein
MPTTEWRDGRGRSYWQPTLDDGDRRWWRHDGYVEEINISWSVDQPKGWEPTVCRSQRKAERVARREQRRLDNLRLDQITEVKQ